MLVFNNSRLTIRIGSQTIAPKATAELMESDGLNQYVEKGLLTIIEQEEVCHASNVQSD